MSESGASGSSCGTSLSPAPSPSLCPSLSPSLSRPWSLPRPLRPRTPERGIDYLKHQAVHLQYIHILLSNWTAGILFMLCGNFVGLATFNCFIDFPTSKKENLVTLYYKHDLVTFTKTHTWGLSPVLKINIVTFAIIQSLQNKIKTEWVTKVSTYDVQLSVVPGSGKQSGGRPGNETNTNICDFIQREKRH